MENVQPVQMKIYRSNAYGKDLRHYSDLPKSSYTASKGQTVLHRGTSPDITTVSHERQYGRFI